MIYTREQLRAELFNIINSIIDINYEYTDQQDIDDCTNQLADFIANLNEPYVDAEDEIK